MNFHRAISKALILGSGYLFVSCLVHYIILPEALPDLEDYPKQGDVIFNQQAGERVEFTKDRFHGDPNVVIIEVDLAANGSVPMAHVHSNMHEVFSGLTAQTEMQINNKRHTLTRGQSVDVPAGAAHLPYNTSSTPSKVEVVMNPVGVFDLCLVNIHRLLSRPESEQNWLRTQLQLARYASFCDVYRPDIPILVQQVGLFFLNPTIRAMGYHAWKGVEP